VRRAFQRPADARRGGRRDGAALIVALWTILILSLLIGGFAFDMHIEAGITSHARKRMKAAALANAGVEWAYALLDRRSDVDPTAPGAEESDMLAPAVNLSRGVAVRGVRRELGDGSFTVSVIPEKGRRNVNELDDRDWEELLDQANVPRELWPELIDCFADWIDGNDEHHLNGAESDDPYYQDRGYAVKNGPVDTVDELLLIKGFSRRLVYGGPAPDESEQDYRGIAQHLTAWGDGRVNINTASREVLLTIPDIDEWTVDAILESRLGVDGEAGTLDDGFETLDEALNLLPELEQFKDRLTTADVDYVRVVSVGHVGEVRIGIWCILKVSDRALRPVYWREEPLS
jgi:general secretion pathway protein K